MLYWTVFVKYILLKTFNSIRELAKTFNSIRELAKTFNDSRELENL